MPCFRAGALADRRLAAMRQCGFCILARQFPISARGSKRSETAMKTARIGAPPRTFQDLIFALQRYWSAQGCVVLQPYVMEGWAGTLPTAASLRGVAPEAWAAASAT